MSESLAIGQAVRIPRRVPIGAPSQWDDATVQGFARQGTWVLVFVKRTERFRWLDASKVSAA